MKIATRNMFYDEQGKHRRTKKEILDEQGNIRAGCSIISKGEVYESHIFTKKEEWFKDKSFTKEVKELFTDTINLLCKRRIRKTFCIPAGRCLSSNEENRKEQSEGRGDKGRQCGKAGMESDS